MFENSNKEVIREIARESMKSHRLQSDGCSGNWADHATDYNDLHSGNQLL
mgnify:CR=1 FL=1